MVGTIERRIIMKKLLLLIALFLFIACSKEEAAPKPERTADTLTVYQKGDSLVYLQYSEVDGLSATLNYEFHLEQHIIDNGSESWFFRDKVIYCHYDEDSIPSVKCTLSVVDSVVSSDHKALAAYGINPIVLSEMMKCGEVGIITGGRRVTGEKIKALQW